MSKKDYFKEAFRQFQNKKKKSKKTILQYDTSIYVFTYNLGIYRSHEHEETTTKENR